MNWPEREIASTPERPDGTCERCGRTMYSWSPTKALHPGEMDPDMCEECEDQLIEQTSEADDLQCEVPLSDGEQWLADLVREHGMGPHVLRRMRRRIRRGVGLMSRDAARAHLDAMDDFVYTRDLQRRLAGCSSPRLEHTLRRCLEQAVENG